MKRLLLIPVVVLAVLVSACGTRVPEQTKAAAAVQSGGQGSGGAAVGASPGAGGKPMFGTMEAPCGPGGDPAKNTASDVGVTPSEIRIATISDPGGPKPGLDQGVLDSMEAFAAWCNDLGGINGRKIKLDLLDAKITEYGLRVEGACTTDFALVGGMGVLDNLGAQKQVDCGLPNVVGVAVNPEQSGAELTFQSLPNPPWTYNVGPTMWVAQRFPDAIKKAASVVTNLSITKIQGDRLVEGYEKKGFTFVSRPSANISETNWGPIVADMKSKGVTFMTLTSSFEEVIPLEKEMAAQNFKPVVELETNYYNQKFPEQAGSAADGTFVRLHTWPVEEKDQNPAMKQYREIMERYKPDGVLEFLGVQAFSSGLLWASAVRSLGPDVTRAGLVKALADTHSWDGGGIQAPTDPGNVKASSCFIIMKVDNGGFVREYPKPDTDAEVYNNSVQKGFACPDGGFVDLTAQDYRALGARKK